MDGKKKNIIRGEERREHGEATENKKKNKKMIQVETKNAPDTRHKTELLECLDHANPLDNKYTLPCYLHLPIGQRDNLHSC